MKADILRKSTSGWELYEVKSSTQQKEFNLEDIAFQKHVLTESGIPVSKTFLIHINNEYVRNGDIEPEKLFSIVDLTEAVEARQAIHQSGNRKAEAGTVITSSEYRYRRVLFVSIRMRFYESLLETYTGGFSLFLKGKRYKEVRFVQAGHYPFEGCSNGILASSRADTDRLPDGEENHHKQKGT